MLKLTTDYWLLTAGYWGPKALFDKWSELTEYFAITDHSSPDYQLEATTELSAEQIKVLFDDTRLAIADLLTERAASITQLAKALDRPKGSVGHHVKVMEEAGLIRVVRTRKVRAIEEKFYGRTARTFLLESMQEAGVSPDIFVRQALAEIPLDKEGGLMTLRYARISQDRAEQWSLRLAGLVDEFISQPRSGRSSYGLLVALYPTNRPVLEDER